MHKLAPHSKSKSSCQQFHLDQQGMSSLQTVVIMAIAALVLAGLHWVWNTAEVGAEKGIKGATAALLKELFSADYGAPSASGPPITPGQTPPGPIPGPNPTPTPSPIIPTPEPVNPGPIPPPASNNDNVNETVDAVHDALGMDNPPLTVEQSLAILEALRDYFGLHDRTLVEAFENKPMRAIGISKLLLPAFKRFVFSAIQDNPQALVDFHNNNPGVIMDWGQQIGMFYPGNLIDAIEAFESGAIGTADFRDQVVESSMAYHNYLNGYPVNTVTGDFADLLLGFPPAQEVINPPKPENDEGDW